MPGSSLLLNGATHPIINKSTQQHPNKGTTTWAYTLTDAYNQTAVGWVTITTPPGAVVATDDAYACAFEAPCTGGAADGLLANDSSPNAGATLSAALAEAPANGTIQLASNGSFVYTPAA